MRYQAAFACLLMFAMSTSVLAQRDDNLIALARTGTTSELRDALASGANPNARAADGTTLLMASVKNSEHALESVPLLLAAGADPNARSLAGTTAMAYAIMSFEEYAAETLRAVVRELLHAGANPDEPGLLMLATVTRDAGLVRIILESGVDVDARDESGKTPLMWAALSSQNSGVVVELLSAGADPNAVDIVGWSALHLAALVSANAQTIAALLAAGADVDARGRYGATPLMLVAAIAEPEVVIAVMEAGADVNATSDGGLTVLMHAANANPNPAVIDLLLDAGADARRVSDRGQRAIDAARSNDALVGTTTFWRLNDLSY